VILHPRSIRNLILLGFSLVALPLVCALVYTAFYVEKLVVQSQETVLQAMRATQSSNQLVDLITDMERNARQFQVLNDKSLLKLYAENHRDGQDILKNLQKLEHDEAYKRLLNEFSERETAIFKTLSAPNNSAKTLQQAISGFKNLERVAENIHTASQNIIKEKLEQVENTAASAENVLVWQAIALVPVALLITAIFTVLITRPIKQIDQAIRTLGEGQFTASVQISGPEDLVQLGQRLNWLRLRLLELEQEKNKFLRHVSHELKTPLTAIREGSELLLDEIVGKLHPEQREIVQILKKNSLHLQKLIENLLNFSAAHFQNLNLTIEEQHLKSLILQVINDHSLQIKAKSLQVDTDLEELSFEGDAEKLKSIIDNLLSNAFKYAPPGTTVYLKLYEQGNFAIFEVADQGVGISTTDRPKIFEAFYQGQFHAQGAIKGSGLGLSIVKEYVQAHHGKVELLETRCGAHFRVTLPKNYVDSAC
jgi:two-component system sensor histidine kinase GlrK